MKSLRKCLSLFAIVCATFANAASFVVDGLRYESSTGFTCEVVGSDGDISGALSIPSKVNYDNAEYSVVSIGESAFSGKKGITSVEIPESVLNIKKYAFSNTGLKGVNLPSTVERIGEYAFNECYDMTEIHIDARVVDERAFFLCLNLQKIYVGSNVAKLGYSMFGFCDKIRELHVSSLYDWMQVEIGDRYGGIFYMEMGSGQVITPIDLYEGDNKVDDLVLPDLTYNVPKWAFATLSIRSLNTGNTLLSISERAFSNCLNLKNVELTNTVTTIDRYAFAGCASLESIDLPGSLEKIEEYAFYECESLEKIEMPERLSYIGQSCFFGCTALRSVTFNEWITSVSASAFYGCKALSHVALPDNVTVIGSNAFYGCERLVAVEMGKGMSEISSGAFFNCVSLRNIICSAAEAPSVFVQENSWMTQLSTFDGVNYKTCKVYVPADAVDAYKAAKGWGEFENIYPLGYEDPYVFMADDIAYRIIAQGMCEVVKADDIYSGDVVIPEVVKKGTKEYSVTRIGDYVFEYCFDVTSVTLSEGIEAIGDYAFYCCRNLEAITVPSTTKRIGTRAFAGCERLKEVCVKRMTPPTSDSEYGPFDWDTYNRATLYVPLGAKNNYKKADYWKEFRNIEEMDMGSTAAVEVNDAMVTVSDGGCYVSAADGCIVEIYDVAGAKAYVGNGGFVPLASGVYVVKAGGIVKKIRI